MVHLKTVRRGNDRWHTSRGGRKIRITLYWHIQVLLHRTQAETHTQEDSQTMPLYSSIYETMYVNIDDMKLTWAKWQSYRWIHTRTYAYRCSYSIVQHKYTQIDAYTSKYSSIYEKSSWHSHICTYTHVSIRIHTYTCIYNYVRLSYTETDINSSKYWPMYVHIDVCTHILPRMGISTNIYMHIHLFTTTYYLHIHSQATT